MTAIERIRFCSFGLSEKINVPFSTRDSKKKKISVFFKCEIQIKMGSQE